MKNPGINNYRKLDMAMKHLQSTEDIDLTLEVSNVKMVKWWVDRQF